MDISINPSEVTAFSRQLMQWANQMKSTKSTIVSATRSLEQHWKDPQFLMFVEIVKGHGQTLGTSIDQFEKISKELGELAKQLDEMKRQQQRRINNLR
jgi:uncharacterized protein YukE